MTGRAACVSVFSGIDTARMTAPQTFFSVPEQTFESMSSDRRIQRFRGFRPDRSEFALSDVENDYAWY
jgi:hypothetical protein